MTEHQVNMIHGLIRYAVERATVCPSQQLLLPSCPTTGEKSVLASWEELRELGRALHNTVFLPNDFLANEKNNTWLFNAEGHHVGWFDLPHTNLKLEVSVTLANSPGVYVAILPEQESVNLTSHVSKQLKGWQVRSCHVEGVKQKGNEVA